MHQVSHRSSGKLSDFALLIQNLQELQCQHRSNWLVSCQDQSLQASLCSRLPCSNILHSGKHSKRMLTHSCGAAAPICAGTGGLQHVGNHPLLQPCMQFEQVPASSSEPREESKRITCKMYYVARLMLEGTLAVSELLVHSQISHMGHGHTWSQAWTAAVVEAAEGCSMAWQACPHSHPTRATTASHHMPCSVSTSPAWLACAACSTARQVQQGRICGSIQLCFSLQVDVSCQHSTAQHCITCQAGSAPALPG